MFSYDVKWNVISLVDSFWIPHYICTCVWVGWCMHVQEHAHDVMTSCDLFGAYTYVCMSYGNTCFTPQLVLQRVIGYVCFRKRQLITHTIMWSNLVTSWHASSCTCSLWFSNKEKCLKLIICQKGNTWMALYEECRHWGRGFSLSSWHCTSSCVTAHVVCDLAIKKNASNLSHAKKVTHGWHYMKSVDTGGGASPSSPPPHQD